jgi:hypothetical protein
MRGILSFLNRTPDADKSFNRSSGNFTATAGRWPIRDFSYVARAFAQGKENVFPVCPIL